MYKHPNDYEIKNGLSDQCVLRTENGNIFTAGKDKVLRVYNEQFILKEIIYLKGYPNCMLQDGQTLIIGEDGI